MKKLSELEELLREELELQEEIDPDAVTVGTEMPSGEDHTLLELEIGIVAFGLVCLGIGLIFVQNRPYYGLGLLLGMILAMLAAFHMWWALDRALDQGEEAAKKMITTQSLIRYGCIVIAMGLIMVSGFANPLAAFLGLMGLKAAAYLQPLTHRITAMFMTKKNRR